MGDARQAINEYRRFCLLAVVAGHPVTPSADVDEVWHLHLTYTRDYWLQFCPVVLGCALHHGPTGGGAAEDLRYREQYGDTLRSYARYFGTPPARWWPARKARFAGAATMRRVDVRRTWLLPKPALPAMASRIAVLLGSAALCTPTMAQALSDNPLDWPAGPFLMLYAALIVLAMIAALIIRRRGGETAAAVLSPPLSLAEQAYLAGGAERVAEAAVTDLLVKQAIECDAASKSLRPTGNPAVLDPTSEQALRCLQADPNLKRAMRRIVRAQQPLRKALVRRHLWLDGDSARRLAWLSALPALAVATFGVVRIVLGLARERPVLLLVMLTVAAAIMGLVLWLKSPGRSREGDRYLRDARRRHSVLLRAPTEQQLALAVALGGTAILADTMFADFHRMRAPAGDGGSSGGDSLSDGGGGSSGCGGCGGD